MFVLFFLKERVPSGGRTLDESVTNDTCSWLSVNPPRLDPCPRTLLHLRLGSLLFHRTWKHFTDCQSVFQLLHQIRAKSHQLTLLIEMTLLLQDIAIATKFHAALPLLSRGAARGASLSLNNGPITFRTTVRADFGSYLHCSSLRLSLRSPQSQWLHFSRSTAAQNAISNTHFKIMSRFTDSTTTHVALKTFAR